MRMISMFYGIVIRTYLDLGVFRELQDIGYFNRVHVRFGAVTGPHEQDIAPKTLVAGMIEVAGAPA